MTQFSYPILFSSILSLLAFSENTVFRQRALYKTMQQEVVSFQHVSGLEAPALSDAIPSVNTSPTQTRPLDEVMPPLHSSIVMPLDSPVYHLSLLDTPPDSNENPNNHIGDPTTAPPSSPLWFKNPDNYEVKYELSEDGKGYYIYEQVGGINVRPPSYISMKDYLEMRELKATKDYFQEQSLLSNSEQKKSLLPSFEIEKLNDIFGGGSISIQPTGSATLNFSVDRNKIANPALPIRQQKNTFFNFDQQLQVGVLGNIGDKMKLNISQDTRATFDFENIFKIDYTGDEDQLLQRLETGNVSMPLGNTLIQGGQNLFGLKAGIKLGPVKITALASMDRGQRNSVTAKGSGNGGTIETPFKKNIADYDQNRHFFLSHFFRSKYDESLQTLPQINSRVFITQVEVWVTNPNVTQVSNLRPGIGFIDMGENPQDYARGKGVVFNPNVLPDNDTILPDKSCNNLYKYLKNNPDLRDKSKAANALQNSSFQMVNGVDFQLVNLRKLQENKDYYFHPQLGYVSLNSPLQSDDVLFVSYAYTYNGKAYQVGEFSNDVAANADNSNPIFLKMLRPSQFRPIYNGKKYPVWDLMMKNVYSISYGIQPNGFRMQVMYETGTKAGKVNFLPKTQDTTLQNIPLLQLTGLDRLTNNTAPEPDNMFDFIEQLTVRSDKGFIMFPHIEPFGRHLANRLNNDPDSVKYVYQPLYDMTYQDAIQKFPELNRYTLEGTYQGGGPNSAGGAEIPLNAFGVSPQSITVTANGVRLTLGTDYDIDPSGSKVILKNAAYLQPGQDIKVNFDQQQAFQMQTKTLTGIRAEYEPTKETKIGLTAMRLAERPTNFKTTIGDEPIKNTVWGVDIASKKDLPRLTKFIDKLPLISTKAPSSYTLSGEWAHFMPGQPKQVMQDSLQGITYVDDFESSKMPYTMMGGQRWKLASFPTYNAAAASSLYDPRVDYPTDPLAIGFSRARLAWYQIDAQVYNDNLAKIPKSDKENSYTRAITPQEIFPQLTNQAFSAYQNTLDLHYYPQKRGPYNYQTDKNKLSISGSFVNPKENWAGISTDINSNTDFEAQNVEFIEFWMLDPFLDQFQDSLGGDLYLHLGNVSEDVIPDNLQSFENGLPSDGTDNNTSINDWGRVPNSIPPSNVFANTIDGRKNQDVGLDGLSTDRERDFFKPKLDKIAADFGTGSAIYQALLADPSTDDYKHFLDAEYNGRTASIIERFSQVFGTENNSPANESTNNGYTLQATQYPDNEDINQNGTLNNWEEYWEYKIKINPTDLTPGKNYVVDKITTIVPLNSSGSQTDKVTWYQFRIPIRSGKPINNIPNFKVINFLRMYMTNFPNEIVLRMTELQTVATQWRKFEGILTDKPVVGDPPLPCNTFDVGSVSVQENSKKLPFNYVVPPNVFRQGLNGNTASGYLQDERSLVVKATCLPEGEGRAIFKYVNQDFRNYKKMRLWVHAEPIQSAFNDPHFEKVGDAVAFIRLGLDNDLNYYEYEIPLNPSNPDPAIVAFDTANIWRNLFNFEFDWLTAAKTARNISGFSNEERYLYENSSLPQFHKIFVKGTPKLSDVRVIMIGIRNPEGVAEGPINVEMWVNELSLTKFDGKSAWAANSGFTLQLADVASIQGNMQFKKAGFGSLDQRISQRTREDIFRYSLAGDFQLHKIFPAKWGLSLPFHANQDEQFKNPEFDPREADVKTKELYKILTPEEKKETKAIIQEYTRNRGFSFNNIKKNKTGKDTKDRIWNISNFDASYSYSEQFNRSYLIERNVMTNHRAALNYRYNIKSPNIQPFKKWKKKNPISEFNFSPLPKSFSVALIGDRVFSENLYRPTLFGGKSIPVYTKNFVLTRNYTLGWDFTKSLSLNFNAANQARIDEVKGYWEKSPEWQKDSIGYWTDNLFHFGKDTTFASGYKPNGQPYEYQRAYNQTLNVGRNIGYNHNIALTYTLPFNKFKWTDYLTGNVAYTGIYQWQNPPEVNRGLGATIVNGQTINGSSRLDLNGLYGKWKPLKKMLDPLPYKPLPKYKPKKGEKGVPKIDNKTKQPTNLKDPKAKKDINPEWKDKWKLNPPKDRKFLKAVLRTVVRLILSVKNIDGTYNMTAGTTLPGYLPYTDNLGMDFGYRDSATFQKSPIIAPTWQFVSGLQQDIRPLAARYNWLTRDTTLSNYFMQTSAEQISLKSSVEPIPGLKVDVNATRNTTTNFSENFRWDPATNNYIHTAEQFMGTYTVSYLFINTAFGKKPEQVFQQFSDARQIISQRLSKENPYSSQLGYQGLVDGGYQNGYTGTNQEVLIPSLLAGYGVVKPEKVQLSPFPQIPLPNWTINFNPTVAFPQLKEVFTSISIKHTYQGNYSVGGYNRNLFAEDKNRDLYGDNTTIVGQTANGQDIENFNPIRNIAVVQVQERFAPLVGVNATFKSGVTTNISYGQGRTMNLNIGNLQLTEESNKDLTVSMGYRKDKMNMHLRLFGREINLKNSANFNLALTMRDSYLKNRPLDGQATDPLRGNFTLNINPSIDYVISNRLNIRLFWQENISNPKTAPATSFRSAGLQLRLNFN